MTERSGRCPRCTGWRTGEDVVVTDDIPQIAHKIAPGSTVTLNEVGHYFRQDQHYWMVLVHEGTWEGKRRAVCCVSMTMEVTEDEEREVLERIQTSVRKEAA